MADRIDATVTYGGSSDLWGETWTPADINAAGFGAAIAVTDGLDTAGVDHITAKVYFTLCAATPAAGCRAAGKSVLVINDKTPDAKDKLVWKWIKGESTATAEFADPINTAVYSLCVYEDVAENLIANATVPASSTLWKPISTKGFKYLDKNLTQSGVQKIIVKASINNKAKAIFKGKGTGLPDITPALALPVKVQLINSDSGICWEASYDMPDMPATIQARTRRGTSSRRSTSIELPPRVTASLREELSGQVGGREHGPGSRLPVDR